MRLAGVIISTSPDRHPAMRDFYVDVLGLEPRSDRPGFVNFELEETRLTIATHSAVAGSNPEPGRILINFSVDDAAAAYRRFTDAGARSVRRPEPEKWGGIVATLADPDGNFVQLLQLNTE